MIVDCHVHLNDYTKRSGPSQTRLEGLLHRMQRYKVDHAIVLSSYLVNEQRPAVEELLRLCGPHPQLSVVEGVLWEDGRPTGLDGLRDRLEARRIVGIKMYAGYLPFYPNAPECEPVYDLAQEFDVPVMFHTGDTYARGAKVKYAQPLVLDDVAVDHPDMQIVLCHLGNPWFRDTAEVVYKNENAHADISGLVLEGFEANLEKRIASEVRDLIAYGADADRLLYGTDWPLVRMGPYIDFVRSLGLSEKDTENIMWRNADRLFKLKLRSRARARTRVPRASDRPAASATRGKKRGRR